MKTIKNILNDLNDLKIVYRDLDEGKDGSTIILINDLNEEQKGTLSNYHSLFENRLQEGETLSYSLTQIDIKEHLSEERIIWKIENSETVYFIIISSINNEEKIIYQNYINLVNNLINS